MLPFGLRSAPKLFNAVADALQWIAVQQGAWYINHYLDDFIVIGTPGSDKCERPSRLGTDMPTAGGADCRREDGRTIYLHGVFGN